MPDLRRREGTATVTSDQRIARGLVVEDVRKHFRGVKALEGVSLTTKPNEILGLIGPNGSGKTTLINVVSGVYRADSGRVWCGGREVTRLSSHRIAHAGVGRTFQNIRVFGHLTVRENVEVGAVSRPAGRDNRQGDVDELLQRFHLSAAADCQASSLPYGDQRKVEIARALAGRPTFLLLDEPAAGMNDAESDDLLSTIAGVRAEYGCGILIVDHDLRLIMRLCDRIQVLAEGRTLAVGTPESVRQNKEVVEVFLGDALKDYGDHGDHRPPSHS